MDNLKDIIIIGAGPVGLFTVFEAGLLGLKCHLIDALGAPGGQLNEIYPKKPIYDIPGHPEILASDLVDNLMKQISPFKPEFTLGETVIELTKDNEGIFTLMTDQGTMLRSKVIAIAAGLGCFEPRKPALANLEFFEKKGVDYIIRDPLKYKNSKIVISGGGDSALDWAIYLVNIASEITLVHRRTEFRGAPESVRKLMELSNSGKINVITNAEVTQLNGSEHLEGVVVSVEGGQPQTLDAQFYIPLFGLTPKLGPIAGWGLGLDKNAIQVNTLDYSTNIPGIFAIGDINTYPGKLKLILCGFHEATLMVQSAYKIIHGGKDPSFKYTTVTGIKPMQ
ncbi:MAG: NAD(P)/FAD-dependent oxidoreductase [Saprospiraceae bacterium]|nr:NAD(P)/FAD-dependent oxidoreductase [Saprospiraceae bacterium]HMW39272.1 NAD(P)/FAD-dependent oxidoreductase [Saprospiraceae bacterium]HMX89094.1 NAD(P)/FAD-dependent oxidoreductase [Saprospiraceae bacterium]HMZ40965.1 NAD(P)/FAD-dependent oxidoreductase [Saprospiraceae bacterium]HNA65102.1 NAD(P)/FAD-dependent oxidoreductase [Saprospiraceae bacterium]